MKKLLIFAVVATMFAACSKDATQDLAAAKPIDKFYATIADNDSRVQLNDACQTVWTSGDRVSVFNKTTGNRRYKFTGNTGDTTGELSYMNGGTTGSAIDKIIAVYPYNASNAVSTDGTITTVVPATQIYCKDSFSIGSCIMVARSDTEKLSFLNVMGWIRIALTGDQTIISIILWGHNSEFIAGKATINDDLSVKLDSNATKLVTLNCGEGVQLSAEPTYFYIAVIPQTFSQGFGVEILDSNNYLASSLVTNTSVTIERNHIVSMNTSECKPLIAPLPNQIWYTTSDDVPITPKSYNGAIVSNTYSNGKGIITFDCAQTSIGGFSGCTKLTSVTIPDGVTEISRSAFRDCEGLTSVTIPDSVTSIGYDAFYNCSKLTSVTIPDSVTSIGDSAFGDCEGLTRVKIGNGVTKIGNSAFYNCSKLTSVTIPDGVTEISRSAFRDCEGLTSVTIPDSVTEIGDSAFAGCTGLTSITIPDSVTQIGDFAFSGCTSLKAFYGKFASADNRYLIDDGVLKSFAPAELTTYIIPDSVTSIGSSAFYGCTGLTSITIPDSVTQIGGSAFNRCTRLTSITIPDSVTYIGSYAFESCTGLTNVTIPDSVTYIGSYAFSNCTGLGIVTIGKGVTEIGAYAFAYCQIPSVYCKPVTPPTLGNKDVFFKKTSRCYIYVPRASLDAYISAKYWSEYKQSILCYDFE